MRHSPLLTVLLLSACGGHPPPTEPPAAAAPAPIGGVVTETAPEAWADAPTPRARAISVRLESLLGAAVSRLIRRNPMPDGMNHDLDYTNSLACVADRSERELVVRIGPPGGQQWDLVTLHVFGPPGALEAEAYASWHRDSEPYAGEWRELSGELRLSDSYPTTEVPIRGEFVLEGSLEARPTRLVGGFVIDALGRCHSRTDGRFVSRHTGRRQTAE